MLCTSVMTLVVALYDGVVTQPSKLSIQPLPHTPDFPMFKRDDLFCTYVVYTVIPYLNSLFCNQEPQHQSLSEQNGSAVVIYFATMSISYEEAAKRIRRDLPHCTITLRGSGDRVRCTVTPRSFAWHVTKVVSSALAAALCSAVFAYVGVRRLM